MIFDGDKIVEVEDNTFTARGKTGRWTKADSVTHFDDFQIEKRLSYAEGHTREGES